MSPQAFSPGRAAPPCNCLALRQAARQLSQLYDRHLAPSGLLTTQYSVLSYLERLGPVGIGALAEALVMDRTTMGRAIRPLQRDGLVEVGSGRDGRTRALRLTAEGGRKLAEARPLWQAAQAEFETRYGTPDAEDLRATLARLVGLFAAEPAFQEARQSI